MFALGDVSRFVGEKEKYYIVKPVWNVITDYLMTILLMLPVLFVSMEIAFGSFECLAAVNCPSISKSRTNISSLFSHITSRNVCETFYSSQNSDTVERTEVLIDLTKQYAKFVNLECSKKAPDFLSYFSIVLFTQAFFLYVLGNIWLKLPTTASVIEHFSTLVIECNNFSCPNFDVILAVSRESGGIDPISENNSDQFNIFEDIETVRIAKTLYEKIQAFKENLTLSSKKFINIRRLYLGQAILQAISTIVFIVVDIVFIKDLQETMSCKITQHIPVPHDYFVCSHGLAPAFTNGLYAFIATMAVSFVLFCITTGWTCYVLQNNWEYDFRTKKLGFFVGTVLSDIDPVEEDFGFLLHLLDFYNNLFVVQLALFLSENSAKKIVEHYLMKKYPVSKLERQLNMHGNKLTFTKLPGIPQTIFELPLARQIEKLELIACKPLKDENFENFSIFTKLTHLSIVECDLESIPQAIFKIQSLVVLNLKGNSIRVIPNINSSMSVPPRLHELNLSNNCLDSKELAEFKKKIKRVKVNTSGNPKIRE